MKFESPRVDQAAAQALFDALPAFMRWPTLSPAYVAVDALRAPKSTPVFLVDRQGDGMLMHAVHESPIGNLDACDWQSPYGYGGPIAHSLDSQALAKAWSRLDEEAASRNVVAEFVRFHPGAQNHHSYPGTVREDRAVTAIDLTAGDLLASYSGRARTAVRKAERLGLRAIRETMDYAIEHFPGFYRQCMREIGADDFYLFSDAYFERLLKLPGARVLSVAQGEERLSMGMFLIGPSQAEYHLSGTLKAHRPTGATNLLLHAAAQTAQAADCLTFYLGGGASARADDPLLRFKASFALPQLAFHIGYKIHDPATYASLRAAAPEAAANSKRVLFYRG